MFFYTENDYLNYLPKDDDDISIISTVEDFYFFRDSLRANKDWNNHLIKQTADLDLNNKELYALSNTSSFYGIYDGGGHIIKNINIINNKQNDMSLFGNLAGTIRNLGLDSGTITTKQRIASAFVSNIINNGVLENSYSNVDIISNYIGTWNRVCGLATMIISGSVRNCYYGGEVSILNPDETNEVYGIAKLGDSMDSINIANVYWPDSILKGTYGSWTNVMAISMETLRSNTSINRLNGYTKLNSGLNEWKLSEITGLPTFTNTVSTGIVMDFLEGNGTADSPYLINNITDFRNFMNILNIKNYDLNYTLFSNVYFAQTASIDFTGEALPLLGIKQGFAGIYDGRGHSVNNISLSGSNGALFGSVVEGGVIKNFGLNGGTLIAESGSVSTIARRISDGSIINTYSTVNITGTASEAFGLIGYIDISGAIENSYYAGKITGQFNKIAGLCKIYKKSSTVSLLNAFSIDTISNLYLDSSTDSDDNLIVNNTMKKSSEYLKSLEFTNTLNNYVAEKEDLYYWFNKSSDAYPVHYGITKPLSTINKLMVDIDALNDESIENDKIIWHYDTSKKEYYLLLPKLADRTKLIPYIEYTGSYSIVKAYDSNNNLLDTLTNGVTTDIFNNDKVILKISNENDSVASYTVNVMQSSIASIYINLEGGNETFSLINADTNHETFGTGTSLIADENGNKMSPIITSMKGRGNSSWMRSKKPYQVKFSEKISMLGMKKSKTWLLLAGYNDGTLTRSYLFYNLANDMGLNYSVECKPADVYVNNEYLGSYLVTSKVEPSSNRVDISDDEYLLEIDNAVDDYQFKTKKGYTITIKNPDLEDYPSQEEINTAITNIKAFIDNVEAKIYNQTITYEELKTIIDVESFAKYYWVQELSLNYDAMVGSSYMYYKDGLIHMGPIWDMDNTLNRSYNYASLTSYYVLDDTNGLQTRMKTNWYRELMKREEFSNLVDKEFIDNIEVIKNLKSEALDYIDYIEPSANMNYIKWPYAKMKTEQAATWISGENNFTTASSNLLNNIETRVNWYLSEYDGLQLKKINYKTVDKKGNDVTGTIDLMNNETINLPANVLNNATINLEGIKENDSKITLSNISLTDGVYKDSVMVKKAITSTTYKAYNTNSYDVSFALLEPELVEILVTTAPNKISYIEGQKFDNTGMVIEASYTDGNKLKITNYTISNTNALTIDDNKIEILYGGKRATVNISVIKNTVTSLEITTMPTKVKYYEGQKFDKTGMVVKATFADNSIKEITNYKISKLDALTMSDTKISISLGEFSKDIQISVLENSITGIKISKNPSKITYVEGQKFDKSGMVVSVIYIDGTIKNVVDYKISNTNKLTISDKKIDVLYDKYKETIAIKVNKNIITGIEITKNPDKIIYNNGEKFDKTGMVVKTKYLDGSATIITDYEIDKNDNLSLNDTIITITYQNFKTNVKISVVDNIIEYKVLDDIKPYDKNNKDEVFVRVDADYTLFKEVYIDGNLLDSSNYTVKSGSTIVEFTKEYLKTLENGTYDVLITFTDGGKASTNLTIANNINDDVVNDNKNNKNYTLIYIIAATSLIVIGSVIYKNKKIAN